MRYRRIVFETKGTPRVADELLTAEFRFNLTADHIA